MKEKITTLIEEDIKPLNLVVDDVYVETEENIKYLRIVLDSETLVDLNRIVEATKIINPLIDNTNLIDDSYILDIYAKEKGVN